jgi:hypothetical protein
MATVCRYLRTEQSSFLKKKHTLADSMHQLAWIEQRISHPPPKGEGHPLRRMAFPF